MSSEYLKPTGGVGQFAKSICQLMNKHSIKVDIITDKKPYDEGFAYNLNANIIYDYNKKSLQYGDHQIIFGKPDSYCLERMINFRYSIMLALSKNMYDAFICNTYETVRLVHDMGLENQIQTIAYTHLESQIFKDTKNPFLSCVNESMRNELLLPGVYIGTQSLFNKLQFENAYELPIPLPEQSLLERHDKPRSGVLFIGRWEEGKNYELYLELIKQTGLPARVLTSETGAEKFEKALKEITNDYVVQYDKIGVEKVDFITSCRVAFNPSLIESYGIAFLEQMTQMPTVALENMRWTNNFDSKYFYTCNKKNMAEKVIELYNKFDTSEKYYSTGAFDHVKNLQDSIFHKWNVCFSDFRCKESESNKAKISSETTVKYSTFIKDLDRKKGLSLENDIRSIYNNKHKFRVIYTDDETYLTKDPTFEPGEEISSKGLFQGL